MDSSLPRRYGSTSLQGSGTRSATAPRARRGRKQIDILEAIKRGSEDGGFIDMDQLLKKISYSTTKASMQFSIRYLIRRGLIEKKPQEIRRGRRRIVYGLTMNALKSFDPGTDQWDIVVEGFNDEDLDPDLDL